MASVCSTDSAVRCVALASMHCATSLWAVPPFQVDMRGSHSIQCNVSTSCFTTDGRGSEDIRFQDLGGLCTCARLDLFFCMRMPTHTE